MDNYQHQAVILKAMAHPIRLHILDLLRQEPECVCHLSAVLGKPQPYISQQLAILRTAGVIRDQREGTNIFYQLADADVAHQLEAALGPGRASNGRHTHGGHQKLTTCNCPKCANTALPQG